MEEYLIVVLDKLALAGFLETRASLSMDLIISFLVMLPILNGISIFFAIREKLVLHQFTQLLLFFLMLISLGFFTYIVYYIKGVEFLLQESSIGSTKAFFVLVAHAIISLTTLILWMFTLLYALSDKKRRALPGLYSQSHREAGKRVFKSICLTSLTSLTSYWVLYVV